MQFSQGPHRILIDTDMDVHYLVYPKYKGPMAFTHFLMESPLAYQSPWHYFLLKLLISTLMDSSGDLTGATNRAGITCQLYPTTVGLLVQIDGFSHRLDKVVLDIVKRISSLDPDPDRVWLSFTSLLANLRLNEDFGPAQIAEKNRETLLCEPHWEDREQVDYIMQVIASGSDGEKSPILPQELKQFSEDFLRCMYVTVLGGGNLTEDSSPERNLSKKRWDFAFCVIPSEDIRGSYVFHPGKTYFRGKCIQTYWTTAPPSMSSTSLSLEEIAKRKSRLNFFARY